MKNNLLRFMLLSLGVLIVSVISAQEDFDNPIDAGGFGVFDCDVEVYTDSRNTCDYSDDVANVSNDVVYTFTLFETTKVLIKMCGDYDTYVYLYDEFQVEISHNDDNNNTTCPDWSSYLVEDLSPGTYFIVCEAYASANPNCGNYDLEVTFNGDFVAPIPDVTDLPDFQADCSIEYIEELSMPTAFDDCTGSVEGTTSTDFPIYESTTIIWSYEDLYGNIETQTQNVVIDDITPPIPDIPEASSFIFTSTDVPNAIIDETTITVDLLVAGLPSSLNSGDLSSVCIDITHTYVSDLDIYLVSPSGTSFELSTDNGSSQDNYTGTCFDMSAATSITAGTAPFTGDFLPEGAGGFDSFNSENPNGVWQLMVNDDSSDDDGFVNAFVINFDLMGGLANVVGECEVTSLIEPTATDNCGGLVTVTNDAILPITTQGTTVVTWTYVDGNGNTSTQTQNVIIDDISAPVMICQTDISVNSDPGLCGALVTYSLPVVVENCSFPNLIINGDASDGLNNWTIILNGGSGWNAEGGVFRTSSNWDTKYQIVDLLAAGYDESVLDLSPEILVSDDYYSYHIPSDPYYLNVELRNASNDVIAAYYSDTIASTSDWQTASHTFTGYGEGVRYIYFEHGGKDVEFWAGQYGAFMTNATVKVLGPKNQTSGLASNSLFPVGTTTNTFESVDAVGNTSTCSFDVVVIDNEAPVADISVLDDVTDECEVVSLIDPTATDACGGAVIVTNDAILPINTQGTTIVIWSYEDQYGNVATQTQNVVINDITLPVLDAPALVDLIAECEITSWSEPTATDNCMGTITGVADVTLPVQGTTTITWTFEDATGNIITQTQEVIIDDATVPVLDEPTLADVTGDCEVTMLSEPTATDNCMGTITGVHDAILPITDQGNTVVTWTFSDSNGNFVTQTQNVIIEDALAPVLDETTLADVTADCEVTVLTEPTATDNCMGIINGVHDLILPITDQGTTVVTWTFTDGNGNFVTQTQNVVLEDIIAPVADVADLTEVVECFEIAALTEPTATDNCGGLVIVTNDATLPITASTTVTWTYEDPNGNMSTQTQSVVINTVDVSVTNASPVLTANATGATYQWLDCDNAMAPIAGEINQSFTATANGNYAVEVTQYGCTEVSECNNVTNVGIENQTDVLGGVSVYPNPTSDILYVQLTNDGETNWTLLSITGQVILEGVNFEERFHLNLEDLAPGVYMLNIQQNDSNITKRVVRK